MPRQNLFHIPYGGNIEEIDVKRAISLSVKEEGAVAKTYHDQHRKIADMGFSNVTVIAPAQAGGLIVRCPAQDVYPVWDSVFGVSPKRDLKVVSSSSIKAEPKIVMAANDDEAIHIKSEYNAAARSNVLDMTTAFNKKAENDDVAPPRFGQRAAISGSHLRILA